MKYEDFNIRITSGAPGAFRVFVSSSMGSGESDMVLPFRPEDAGGLLAGVARTVRGSAQPVLRDLEAVEPVPTNAQRPSVDLGVSLYQAVFRDTVQTMLDQCIGRLRDTKDTGIRIRLEMDLHGDGMTHVASLPWELIRRNPTDVPLSVSKRTTVVRALDVMQPPDPKPFEPPLRVLVIVSNPTGTAGLKLEDERKRIEESWGKLKEVEVHFVAPTVEAILDATAAQEIHVIHFMGHGDFDRKTGQGVLYLEKPDGSPDPLGSERLKAIFIDEADSLRLVFLNACRTAVSTEDTDLDPFAGIATMLIEVGVPAVIAMQFPISDNAAVRFSDTFYRRIVQGMPVDTAVAEGRKALWVDGNPHDEWATPVLFMRSRNGMLFPRTVVTLETIETMETTTAMPPTSAPRQPMLDAPPPTPAAPTGFRRHWRKVAGVAGAAVAGMLAIALFSGGGNDAAALVSDVTLEAMPTSMFTGERLERHIQLRADGRAYTPAQFGQVLAAGGFILARAEPAGVLAIERASKPVTPDGMVFSVAALAPGSAIVWATIVFPEGDSLISEPMEISVAEPEGDLRAALHAMDAAWDAALADDLDDVDVLMLFEEVDSLYGDILETSQLEELDDWKTDMQLLIDLDIVEDSIARDESSTILERLAAAQAYVDAARDIREGHGPAFLDLEPVAVALAEEHATNGFARTISLCPGTGSFCTPTPSATNFEQGQDVTATVWYAVNGSERVHVQWFRDGALVSTSTTESASRGTEDGYRIRWYTRVDAPGQWQVRVYNSINQVVGRLNFTVQ
jgi:hypothetical protein